MTYIASVLVVEQVGRHPTEHAVDLGPKVHVRQDGCLLALLSQEGDESRLDLHGPHRRGGFHEGPFSQSRSHRRGHAFHVTGVPGTRGDGPGEFLEYGLALLGADGIHASPGWQGPVLFKFSLHLTHRRALVPIRHDPSHDVFVTSREHIGTVLGRIQAQPGRRDLLQDDRIKKSRSFRVSNTLLVPTEQDSKEIMIIIRTDASI